MIGNSLMWFIQRVVKARVVYVKTCIKLKSGIQGQKVISAAFSVWIKTP